MKVRSAAFFSVLFFLSLSTPAQFHEQRDVRAALSGRVVSANGERAIPGATVQLQMLAGGGFAETESGRSGEFTFAQLLTGTYTVTVRAPGAPDTKETVQVERANPPLVLRVSAGKAGPAPRGATVSVHELKIPGDARKDFEKGMELLARGDSGGSIAQFERAIVAYPAYYEAYYRLGTAQLDLGRGDQAGEAFEKAITASDGRFAAAYFALGLVLCKRSNFVRAETLAESGLSLEPASILGEFALAWAEVGLGRLADAEFAAREVAQRKPDFAEAHLLLAEIHRRENKLEALVDDLDGYLALDGTSLRSAQMRVMRDLAVRSLTPTPHAMAAANIEH
ncbi:MAG TPA: carboxypeptidase regulatory-like domain-containing protein [Methylomirabilota bacterium]|nr:carboxypeptidase regulatory-like domain-containing protein [Methylomirabilota bacterium]